MRALFQGINEFVDRLINSILQKNMKQESKKVIKFNDKKLIVQDNGVDPEDEIHFNSRIEQ
jgi:hypothetical protein